MADVFSATLATGLSGGLGSGLETPRPNASPLLKTSPQINSNKHPGPPLTPFQLTLETVGLSGLLLQQLPRQLKHPNLASGLSSLGATRPTQPATIHSRISSSSLKKGGWGGFQAGNLPFQTQSSKEKQKLSLSEADH